MPTERQVMTNTALQVMGKLFGAVMSLLIIKLVTQFGTDFYGAYKVSYDFLAFFGTLADMGLFYIAVKGMSAQRDQSAKIIGNVLSVRVALVAGAVLLAGTVAQFIPEYGGLIAHGVWITGLSMAFTIVAGTLSSVLQSRMRIGSFSFAFGLSRGLFLLLVWQLLKMYPEGGESLFFALLWAGVFINVLFAGFTAYAANKLVKIRFRWDYEWIREYVVKGLPYGVAIVLETLYVRLDLLLLSILRGTSIAGVYGIAASLIENLRVLGIYFAQAMLPRLTVRAKAGDLSSAYGWGALKLLAVVSPLVVGGLVYSDAIVALITSDVAFVADGASPWVFRLLLPALAFSFFNQLTINAHVAAGMQNKILKMNMAALSLNLVLNLVFIPKHGMTAAAITTVLCEGLVLIQLLFSLRKRLSFTLPIRSLGAIFLANCIMFSLIFLTPLKGMIILGGLCGAAAYGITLWVCDRSLLRGAST